MKNLARLLRLFAPAFLVAIASTGAASEPVESSSALTSATPASAAPSSSAPVKPPPPPHVLGSEIPVERSPVPKPSEWVGAKEVSAVGFSTCKLHLIREWLSMECEDDYAAGLVAGDPKDVHLSAKGTLFQWDQVTQKLTHAYVTAVVPIERGKARIISFMDPAGGSMGGDYGPMIPGESSSLQVWWRDGDADPSIVLTNP